MDFAAILESAVSGTLLGPRKIVIYGGPKIGKTTFAAMAPNPILIPTEDGSRDIDVARLPLLKRYCDVIDAAKALAYGEHDYKTAILDSADWTERLLLSDIAKKHGKTSFQSIKFGEGDGDARNLLHDLLDLFDVMHGRGMHTIIIAHADSERFNSPEVEAYDRWIPRLHKKLWPLLTEWAYEVLFATRKVYTTKDDAGFGNKRTRATGGEDRVIRTAERPAYVAGNRLNLPDELPLDWREFAKYLPEF